MQNSDFPSVRRSRRIIQLENYPRPQFLQKFKAEMLQFHVHSLDSQFLPQIVDERCFYLLLDRLPNFELRCRLFQTAVDRFIDRIVCRVTKISPGRVASGLQSTNRLVLTTGLFVDCRPLGTLAGLILVTRHAVHSCHCPGDMVVRMRKVMAKLRPWYVCFSAVNWYCLRFLSIHGQFCGASSVAK